MGKWLGFRASSRGPEREPQFVLFRVRFFLKHYETRLKIYRKPLKTRPSGVPAGAGFGGREAGAKFQTLALGSCRLQGGKP